MRTSNTTANHIVFIPGFMCDDRLFETQSIALKQAGISCDVEVMSTEATIHEFALNILDRSPERFALAGLSMGGIVALTLIRIAPQRVTHLALMNTTPNIDTSQEQRKKHIGRARDGDLLDIFISDLKPKYLSPATPKPEILNTIKDMGESLGVETFIRQSIALMTRRSNLDVLQKIDCPTLLLTGDHDTICPPSLHLDMANKIRNSQLRLIPNCGHLSTLEAPEIVTQHLFEHWGLAETNVSKFPIERVRRLPKMMKREYNA